MTEDRAIYEVKGRVRRETRLPFGDPRYQAPTTDEIRLALSKSGLTGSAAGELLGVTGRTVRKWTGGEREIPYSAWRLLLIETGMALEGQTSRQAAE